MTRNYQKKLKILIADDHAVVCKGIEQILATTTDLVAWGTANTGDEVLETLQKRKYDMVLLDISMPGISGLKLLRQIKKEKPGLPVVMLSVYPEERYAVEFLKTGASAYVNKTSAPDQLVDIIRKVSRGETCIGPNLAQKIALDFIQSNTLPHQSLTEREFQVMCMIASGKSVSEIANDLSLSVKTVSTHRTKIMDKMKMKSNADLTNYCLKNFLVD